MKKFFIFLLLFVIAGKFAQSQSNTKVGLSGSFQGSQYGIYVPVRIGDAFAIVPGIDIKYAQSIGAETIISVCPRYYLKAEELSPYFGLKGGFALFLISEDTYLSSFDHRLDFLGGLAFGLEYFLTEHLSFGVEAQGNFTISDKSSNRYGNPGGFNFNLGTMVQISIYF